MYINRKGVVDSKGIRGTVREMVSDIESVVLMIGKDAVDIFYDIYEDIIDLRWDVFVYRMHKKGILATEQKVSRTSAFMSSILGLIFFQR